MHYQVGDRIIRTGHHFNGHIAMIIKVPTNIYRNYEVELLELPTVPVTGYRQGKIQKWSSAFFEHCPVAEPDWEV